MSVSGEIPSHVPDATAAPILRTTGETAKIVRWYVGRELGRITGRASAWSVALDPVMSGVVAPLCSVV